MKTLLICHKDSVLSYRGIATWLNAFSDLAGIVVIEEKKNKKINRIKKEMKRSGVGGLIDVFLFRFYYKMFRQSKDRIIEQSILTQIKNQYGEVDFDNIDKITVSTPNARAAQEFIQHIEPDFIIARCKFLLKERVFSIPRFGTYVFHPGICPEYRNAHGCFWAIMKKDYENVGMTMLKIDKGVDTGPVFGYFTYDYDAVRESHVTIQSRVVFDNLEGIRDKLTEIYKGTARPLEIDKQRKSNVWGQPRLTVYLRWKWQGN